MTSRRVPIEALGGLLTNWVESQTQGLLDGMSLIPAPVLPGVPGAPLQPPGVGTIWQIDYFEYDPFNYNVCLTYFPLVGSETVFIVRPPSGTPVLVPGSGWKAAPDNGSVFQVFPSGAQIGDIIVVQYAHATTPGTGDCTAPEPPDVCDPPAISSPPTASATIPVRMPPWRFFTYWSTFGPGSSYVGDGTPAYGTWRLDDEPVEWIALSDGTVSGVLYEEGWSSGGGHPPSYAMARICARGSGSLSVTLSSGSTTGTAQIASLTGEWAYYKVAVPGEVTDYMVDGCSITMQSSGSVEVCDAWILGIFPVGSAYATPWINTGVVTEVYDSRGNSRWNLSQTTPSSQLGSTDDFDSIFTRQDSFTPNSGTIGGNSSAISMIERNIGLTSGTPDLDVYDNQRYDAQGMIAAESKTSIGEYDGYDDPALLEYEEDNACQQFLIAHPDFDPELDMNDFYSSHYDQDASNRYDLWQWAPMTEIEGASFEPDHLFLDGELRSDPTHSEDIGPAPSWQFHHITSVETEGTGWSTNYFPGDLITLGTPAGPVIGPGETHTGLIIPMTQSAADPAFPGGNVIGVVAGVAGAYTYPRPNRGISLFNSWKVSYDILFTGVPRIMVRWTVPPVRYIYEADWTPGEC